MSDSGPLSCNECSWSATADSELKQVESGVHHAICTGHEVSEADLVERYDRLRGCHRMTDIDLDEWPGYHLSVSSEGEQIYEGVVEDVEFRGRYATVNGPVIEFYDPDPIPPESSEITTKRQTHDGGVNFQTAYQISATQPLDVDITLLLTRSIDMDVVVDQ